MPATPPNPDPNDEFRKLIFNVLFGTLLFLIIALAAFGLDWFVNFAKNRGSSIGIVDSVKVMEYVLLVVDFIVFLGFLWNEIKKIWHLEKEQSKSKIDIERSLHYIFITIVVLVLVLSASIIMAIFPNQGMAKQTARTPIIRITQVPKFDLNGGPLSNGFIGGQILGLDAFSAYSIIIYAHTSDWFVQPTMNNYVTAIGPDGKWGASIHLGDEYTAYLIEGTNFVLPNHGTGLPNDPNQYIDSHTITSP